MPAVGRGREPSLDMAGAGRHNRRTTARMAPASGNSPDTAAIRQDAAAELTRALEGALGGSGYRLGAIAFGRAVELRIEQGGAAFTVWLRRLDEPGGPD